MTEKKKLIPCPPYEIASLESWLKDMAAEGLFLKENGLGSFIAVFEKGEPKTMTYRFEPSAYILKTDEILDEENRKNKNEFLTEAGWKNLGIYRMYILYAHEGNAELHTESETEALLRYDAARARTLALLSTAVWIVYFAGLYSGRYMTLLVHIGSLILIIASVFAFFSMCSALYECIRLFYVSAQSERGIPFKHEKDWKKHAFSYRAFRLIRIGAYVTAALAVIAALGDEGAAGRIHIEEYEEDPPFMTVKDLDPDGKYVINEFLNELNPIVNTVRHWSDPLSSDNYIWQEISGLRTETVDYGCAMNVSYYDTDYEFVAKRLYEENRRDILNNAKEMIELSGADEVTAAINGNDYVDLVLRKGNKTVRAGIHVTDAEGERNFSLEAAEKFIGSIQ